MIKKKIWGILLKICRRAFDRQYNQIKEINSKESLSRIQEKHLKNLLLHAYENVPYYNTVFKRIGVVKDNDEVDLSEFDKIPILTKKMIRKHQKELISKDYSSRKWFYNSSGGSTGEPVKFIQDDLYSKWENATNKYFYKNIIGIDEISAKKIIIWGSEKDLFEGSIGSKAKIVNWLTNTIFLNSFRMSEKDMRRFVKIINSHKPDLIRGYTDSLYELCKFIEKRKMRVHTPKIVVSAAETLRDEMRTKIESVFGTKLYDFYGSRESNGIAGECKYGLMHIFTFWNYVEVLDSHNQPVKEGGEGKVIVTNLHNYSMPLIRYEIGDIAVVGPKNCRCGNPLPTLSKITGRITDHFVTEDGTIVPAEFFIHLIGVVCDKGFIRKFQVIQEDYKKIKILVVPERVITESERKDIEDKIKLVMGQNCKIIWEFVKEIPKTKSGKYLYTKSLVWGGR